MRNVKGNQGLSENPKGSGCNVRAKYTFPCTAPENIPSFKGPNTLHLSLHEPLLMH